MKPIGTITNTLPFVDSKYHKEIESFIQESNNYAEFVQKLVDYVLSIDAQDELVYIAYLHADRTDYIKKFEDIIEKYPNSPILRPKYSMWEMTKNDNWDWNRILEEVTHALFCTDNLLIKFDLYDLSWICIRGISPSSMDEERIVQEMQELIDNNSSIKFLQPRIYNIHADQFTREARWSEAQDFYNLIHEETLKHDEIDFHGLTKYGEAYLQARIGDPRALGTINYANQITSELGLLDSRLDWIGISAIVHSTRGEYNRACDLYLELLSKREELNPDLSLRLIPAALSRIYRRMHQFNESIEWGKIGLESKPMLSYTHHHGRKALSNVYIASAYALLGKTEKALPHLNEASKLIMDSGGELWLSDLYLCHGFIERQEGNLFDAMNYFEKAYDIVSRMQRQDRINEVHFRLAETEILLHADGIAELHNGNVKSWNQQFEEMAISKELPGVLGLAYFLKAQILMYQNKSEEAKKYLLRVRDLAINPETQFLLNYLDTLPLYQEIVVDSNSDSLT